jgi:hypothetical protein
MKQFSTTLAGLLCLGGLIVGTASSAKANVWDFSFSSPNSSGSGILTATPLGGGDYLATSVASGFFTGLGLTDQAINLISGGPNPFYSPSGAFIADNVLYSSPPSPSEYIDNWGLLFGWSAGGTSYELNVFGNGPGNGANYSVYVYEPSGGYVVADTGSFTLSDPSGVSSEAATPEPGLYAVLALGLSGLLANARRRRRT